MPYATTTDLEQLGIPAAALSAHPTPSQEKALLASSKLADSYLRERYSLPLVSWGEELTLHVVSIAKWFLITRIGFNPENPSDKAIRLAYEDAIQWLEDVRDANASPDLVDSSGSSGDNTQFVVVSDKSRGF